jgi:hypothetical protein
VGREKENVCGVGKKSKINEVNYFSLNSYMKLILCEGFHIFLHKLIIMHTRIAPQPKKKSFLYRFSVSIGKLSTTTLEKIVK